MIKKTGIYLLLFFIVFLVIGMSSPPKEEIYSFDLQNVRTGEYVSLSEFKGKIILLDFFATWCPPCREQMNVMSKVHDDFSDKGIVVIGVSLDKRYDRNKVMEFLKEKKVEFLAVWGDNKLTDIAKVRAIPTLLAIDRKGEVVDRYVGYHDYDFFDKLIKGMLK
jgi:thiol-disulfide isomerase/thioredoxin